MASINLINNGGFETNWDWTLYPTATYTTENRVSGLRCLKCTPTYPGIYFTQAVQTRYVAPGHTYTVKFYLQHGSTKAARLRPRYVAIVGGQSHMGAFDACGNTPTNGSQTWQITLPSSSDRLVPLTIYLEAAQGTSAVESLWIDNFELIGDDSWFNSASRGTGVNQAKNGSFETTTDWSIGTPAAISTGNAYEGAKCLSFPNRATGGMQSATQQVRVVRGTDYTLSFFAKRTGRMDIWGAYRYTNASGTLQMVHKESLLTFTSETYTLQTYVFQIPANAASDEITLYINAGGEAGDTATGFVDCVELRGQTPAVVTYDQLVNGGFETSEGWAFTGGATYNSGNAYTGSRCLYFPISTTTNRQMAYQNVRLQRGQFYTMTFQAKRNGAKDLWVYYKYTDENQVARVVNLMSLLNSTGLTYSLQTCTFEIPEDAASDLIEICINAGDYTGGTAYAYVDDVTLTQGLPSQPRTLLYADVYLETGRSSGLKVKNGINSETVIGYWPHGRCAVVFPTNDPAWYECRYRGMKGYVNGEFLQNFREADDSQSINTDYDSAYRLEPVARQEESALYDSEPKFYCKDMVKKDSNGNYTQWCHMFADWLSSHCYWGNNYQSRFPFLHNCKAGVKWFLENANFYFANESYKNAVYKISDMKDLVSNGGALTTIEKNYRPNEGDYVYFHDPDKANEVSYHVAVVVRSFNMSLPTGKITIAEGNGADHKVVVRDILKSEFASKNVLGFGEPSGYGHG